MPKLPWIFAGIASLGPLVGWAANYSIFSGLEPGFGIWVFIAWVVCWVLATVFADDNRFSKQEKPS